MKILAAALAAVAFAIPATARAQFEGRLEYEMSRTPGGREGGGTAVLWLGPGGARNEVTMNMKVKDQPQRQLKMVTLWRKAEPGRTYIISDEKKAWSVIEITKDDGQHDSQWQAEKLGSATVAGYPCERARLTNRNGNGGHMEVCVTRKLGKIPLSAFQSHRVDSTLPAALAKAGLDGVPVSWSGRSKDDQEEFAMVLTAAHAERIPASRFEIPSGYQQTGIGAMVSSPEQAKQMDEAMKKLQERMKNMSPEQRKQMEEMMKKYGGTTPDK
jgi:hypothetical protein